MAVVVQQTFTGSTLDQYDEAVAKLGLTAGGPHTHRPWFVVPLCSRDR